MSIKRNRKIGNQRKRKAGTALRGIAIISTIVCLTMACVDSIGASESNPAEESFSPSAAQTSGPVESAIAAVTYPVPLDQELQNFIVTLCEERSIDPALLFAMAEKESNCQPKAVGDGGKSLGLFQVQPRWHKARMDKLGVTDLLDPYQNAKIAVDYLAELVDRGNGVKWALAAYNAGPSGASAGRGSEYAEKILSASDALKGGVTTMVYTDDPAADFAAWDAEQTERLQKRPVCCYCNEHIQDDYFYQLNDEVMCKDCLDSHFRKDVEDYIE